MNPNKRLIASLLFPIICLMGLAAYKAIKIASGTEIIIPIKGYDPRDLLSGRYLVFRLDLNNDDLCGGDPGSKEPVYVCLNRRDDNSLTASSVDAYSIEESRRTCDAVISGRCGEGGFLAGVERFYIPEEYSSQLDKIIRDGLGKIVVNVDERGRASVKDLLINNRPWREFFE